ncbi:hypothetical protein Dimus_016127 [Dionaea muscipula]
MDYYYPKVFKAEDELDFQELADEEIEKIKGIFNELIEEYQHRNEVEVESGVNVSVTSMEVDEPFVNFDAFVSKRKRSKLPRGITELEYYLDDDCVPRI